jgi:hypothetical protein
MSKGTDVNRYIRNIGGYHGMARSPRTDEELKAILREHLQYEMDMLQGTMKRLKSGNVDDVISNALIESYALHVRNLLHFVYPGKHKDDDDVLAADFFDDGCWAGKEPQRPEKSDAAKVAANKQVMHLTYKRLQVSPEFKKWSFALGEEILRVMQSFLREIRQRCPHLLDEPKISSDRHNHVLLEKLGDPSDIQSDAMGGSKVYTDASTKALHSVSHIRRPKP